MQQKISVVINTYNAQQHLRRVLDSVRGFDEILICDMESTDSTLDIAREYGCTIVTFPKRDYVSAEPARTFAIQSAKHDWVLIIDADELVTPELHDFLYAHVRKHTGSSAADFIAGLWIPRKNYFMGQFMHAFYPDFLLRFFIKEGTVWPPNVHTFPEVKGRCEKLPRNRKDLAFIHLADDDMFTCIRKINQYTQNEVEKKSGEQKHYGVGALIWRPFFRFFKAYVLKKGFLDGKAGLVNALIQAVYQIVTVGKIIENEKRSN